MVEKAAIDWFAIAGSFFLQWMSEATGGLTFVCHSRAKQLVYLLLKYIPFNKVCILGEYLIPRSVIFGRHLRRMKNGCFFSAVYRYTHHDRGLGRENDWGGSMDRNYAEVVLIMATNTI